MQFTMRIGPDIENRTRYDGFYAQDIKWTCGRRAWRARWCYEDAQAGPPKGKNGTEPTPASGTGFIFRARTA